MKPDEHIDDPVSAIARAVLYEGYMLWPYRKSALKNQRRWTFGGVFPQRWTEQDHPDDACAMRSECLLELPEGGGEASVDVELRFLHVVERRVAVPEGEWLRFVDELEVGATRYTPWDEAVERHAVVRSVRVDRASAIEGDVVIPAGQETEWLRDRGGRCVGALVRSWRRIRGKMIVHTEPAGERLVRVRVTVRNETPSRARGRPAALRCSFVSTHLALHARGGRFVSMTDPPAEHRDAAEGCASEGCWPVLVGDRDARTDVLASPIILPDFPAVAPQSPGDHFDGGEIDELLVLNILGLTDDEQQEMAASDARTREILERTRALTREQMMGLHGTFREVGE